MTSMWHRSHIIVWAAEAGFGEADDNLISVQRLIEIMLTEGNRGGGGHCLKSAQFCVRHIMWTVLYLDYHVCNCTVCDWKILILDIPNRRTSSDQSRQRLLKQASRYALCSKIDNLIRMFCLIIEIHTRVKLWKMNSKLCNTSFRCWAWSQKTLILYNAIEKNAKYDYER